MQEFDLAIIGGGLVGASFARAISGAGLSTVLIDRMPVNAVSNPLLDKQQDNRGLAISYTTKRLLTRLGLWSLLEGEAYPIEAVHVSEKSSFGFTKLTAASCNLPVLGYVISANKLGQVLLEGLDNLADISVMRPAEISSLSYDNNTCKWNLKLNHATIGAKMLIAADGSNSSIHKKLAMRMNGKDYQQSAIVTNIAIAEKTVTTAYERFTADGVLAILPFGLQRVKCVWTVTNARLNVMLGMSDQEFLAMTQAALGFRVGKLLHLDERKTFPIIHTYAEQLYGPGAVVIGNAANTLHPVAAQGFNLGIRDAVTLANCLRKGLSLDDYANLRSEDHQRTRNFSNNLVQIFSHEMSLVKLSRRLGLLAAHYVPFVNKKIIKQGLGIWM